MTKLESLVSFQFASSMSLISFSNTVQDKTLILVVSLWFHRKRLYTVVHIRWLPRDAFVFCQKPWLLGHGKTQLLATKYNFNWLTNCRSPCVPADCRIICLHRRYNRRYGLSSQCNRSCPSVKFQR